VEDNVVAFTHKGTCRGAAKSVGRAGDEDSGHGIILPSVACDRLDASSATGRGRRKPDNLIWPETS
jgi:hypothetical protein